MPSLVARLYALPPLTGNKLFVYFLFTTDCSTARTRSKYSLTLLF